MTEPALRRADDPVSPDESSVGTSWKEFSAGVHSAAMGVNVLLAGLSTALAVWADGIGRWLLIGLVAGLLLLFVGQVVLGSVKARQRESVRVLTERHRAEVAAALEEAALARQDAAEAREEAARAAGHAAGSAAEADVERARTETLRTRHGAALTALHDMWLGYPAPYTDEVELTYLVGSEAGSDRVVEHRRTTPDPGASLPFIQVRLTTPTQLDQDVHTLADTDLVARAADDRVTIRPVALIEKPGLLRCMFVFVPSVTEPVTWFARYRMAGLWDTLRSTGHDRLTWTPTSRVADRSLSTVARLTVNFDFPPEAGDDVFVRDAENRELKRISSPDGSLRYQWICDEPGPELYAWELWWARIR